MNYEQKYKKLKAGISKAYLYAQTDSTKAVLESILPELKESEDEKIRKELIEKAKETPACIGFNDKNAVLAWLEKQSEDARNIALRTEYEKGRADAIAEISKMSKEVDNQIWQIANNSAKTWEQSFAILEATQTAYDKGRKDALKEHKPADKVEPKFHEGDWVVYVCGEETATLQISRIIEGTYEFTDGSSLNVVDEDTLHHWTIQDAKDGDVLVADNGLTFIYNGYLEERQWPFAYGGINIYGRFNVSDDLLAFTHQKVVPATKEQCDILFSKMREAGYEWDAEKKGLKKLAHQEVTKTSDQETSEWSEEDEKMRIKILEALSAYADHVQYTGCGHPELIRVELMGWLKSLKDRIGG